jgi:hypothetical protein
MGCRRQSRGSGTVGKVVVDDADHIDYLFGRLFNLVYLLAAFTLSF